MVHPTDVILFEGIFALYDERIRDLMTYKIFMHCDVRNPFDSQEGEGGGDSSALLQADI